MRDFEKMIRDRAYELWEHAWQMNSVGKAPDSFVVLDLMRMPLGVWPCVRHNVEKPSFGLLRRGLPLKCLKPDSRARSLDPVDFCFGFMLRPRGPNRE